MLSDIYSLGVLMLQLLTGAASGYDSGQKPPGLVARARAHWNRGRGQIAESNTWPKGAGIDFSQLVFNCLSLNTSDRPNDCAVIYRAIRAIELQPP